jgi:mannose-6-phosphate isomerase-like protein (cupin superfamily)
MRGRSRLQTKEPEVGKRRLEDLRLEDLHFTVADSLRRLPGPAGQRFAPLLSAETCDVEIYAPRGTDPQKPHTRDEAYVVASGTGFFRSGSERRPFGPSDVLLVGAGVEHRFEDFTDDFVTWVFFFGPEKPSSAS